MENGHDSEIDLGLALGITNQHVESCGNTDAGAGAGANANFSSRIDSNTNTKTFFVGPRPLTELVWSTQNGLSIKCADTKDEKRVIEVGSRGTCHVGSVKSPRRITHGPFLGSSLGHTDENVEGVKCVHIIEMENCNKGKEKECMSSSKSIAVGNVAGTSEGPKNQRTADLLPLLANEPEILETKTENISDGTDRLGFNIRLPLKRQETTQSAAKEDCSSSGPFLEKIEETAENDVKDAILENVERDERGGEDSSRGKACEEGNNRDEDESHESMESCNSANLSSKRNKRCRFEQELIVGSKRIKKQSQACPVVKQDSSFMNWISNMVKGLKPCQEDDQKLGVCDKTLNLVSKRLGFQTVFQSLYSQDAKRLETKAQIDSGNADGGSKEIILFDKTVSDHTPDDNLNQKAIGNLWIARFSPKTPSNLLASNNNSDLKSFVGKDSYTDDASASASVGLKQFEKPVALTSSETLKTPYEKAICFFCGKTGHEFRDCLQINENGDVFLKKKVSKQIASSSGKNMSSSEEKILRIPKEMFDAIRRLRLSRTDILKWMNSRLPVANLAGYFLRLRLAKWEEGVGGSGYYVACITDENPSKGSKKPIRVNIGGVECLVESRYISNCEFLEDELIAWWRITLTSGRQAPMEEDLIPKLEERKNLGF